MRASTHQLAFSGAVAFVASSAIGGCHASEPVSPDTGLTHAVTAPELPQPPPGEPRVRTQSIYHVWLGDSLADVCRGPSPFFDFDSAKVDSEAQPTLQLLAACMKDGPLAGQSIRLVGRTDPRGTEGYNDKLGLERAERVKRYLVTRGIDPGRIETESAGECAASDAPKDWPTDRRVEIRRGKPR